MYIKVIHVLIKPLMTYYCAFCTCKWLDLHCFFFKEYFCLFLVHMYIFFNIELWMLHVYVLSLLFLRSMLLNGLDFTHHVVVMICYWRSIKWHHFLLYFVCLKNEKKHFHWTYKIICLHTLHVHVFLGVFASRTKIYYRRS